jgi:hypothetical protein
MDHTRFKQTIQEIDLHNAQDPTKIPHNKDLVPKELLYSQRMTDMLEHFEPGASEYLKLAVRAQHIQRWKIPRDSFPMDKKGYLIWRTELKQMHGELTAAIMKNNNYQDEEIHITSNLINKKRLKSDPEAQTLEDVACLVFLRFYFDEFIAKHEEQEDKIIDILQKTWKKMSDKGHEAALQLHHSTKASALIRRALS